MGGGKRWFYVVVGGDGSKIFFFFFSAAAVVVFFFLFLGPHRNHSSFSFHVCACGNNPSVNRSRRGIEKEEEEPRPCAGRCIFNHLLLLLSFVMLFFFCFFHFIWLEMASGFICSLFFSSNSSLIKNEMK